MEGHDAEKLVPEYDHELAVVVGYLAEPEEQHGDEVHKQIALDKHPVSEVVKELRLTLWRRSIGS